MDRHHTLLWMKDLLDHLGQCHDECEGADPQQCQFWVASMRRDLDELRRLCESLSPAAEGRTSLYASS